MKKHQKQALSLFLSICMALSCLGGAVPAVAAGAEENPEHGDLLYSSDFSDEGAITGWLNPNQFIVEDGVLKGANAEGAVCVGLPEALSGGDYVVSAEVRATEIHPDKGSSAGIVFRAGSGESFFHFRLNNNKQEGMDAQLFRWASGKSSQLAKTKFAWEADRVYTMTAVADGAVIRCYVDGELVADYTDPSYDGAESGEAAGVGFRLWGCSAEFDNLTVSALPAPEPPDGPTPAAFITAPEENAALPSDTTEITLAGTVSGAERAVIQVNGAEAEALALERDGTFTHRITDMTPGRYTVKVTAAGEAGKTAEAVRSFRILYPAPEGAYTFEEPDALAGWTGDAGSYRIAERDGGNHILQGTNSGSALLLAPDRPERDSYRISADVSVTSASHTCAGILFRYADGDNYWYFRLDSGGKAILYQNAQGSWSGYGSTDVGWAVNETYRLAVEADGPYIKCYVDGEPIIQHTDDGYRQPQASGQVGFRLVKCTAEFDNLALGEVSCPSVTITVPAGTVTSMPVSLSGTAAEAGSVELTLRKDGQVQKTLNAPVLADGTYAMEAYLPSGTYTAEAVAVSKGGAGRSDAVESKPFTVALPAAALTAELARSVQAAVDEPVRVVFSAPVDAATLDGVTLRRGGETVAASAAVDPEDVDARTAVITPDEALSADTEYQVVIGAGVRDVMGNGVSEAPLTLTFRTEKDINALPLLDSGRGEDVLSLNGMWDFKTDPDRRGEAARWYMPENTGGWDALAVPGNWDIENDYAHYKGSAWYARAFDVPEQYAGYPVYLEMTAVYHNCKIWLNGHEVGTHDGGYTTFSFRVDQYLNFGQAENTIAVLVDNTYSVGAWWKWGGISGGAVLRVNNAVRLDWQHISTEQDFAAKTAVLSLEYKLTSQATGEKNYLLVSRVFDRETGEQVGEIATPAAVRPGTQRISAAMELEEVKFWHFDDPNLYTVETRLMDGEDVVHSVEDNIGVREIAIDDTHFYLNGEALRLTGADRVWDDRVNGQTEPDYVVMRDIDYMKSMGMNCARMSHVPMSENLLDYCDEVGFLLICESNVWGGPPPKDAEHGYRSVPWYTEMIERDYNHPAIFAWSIGNEMHGGSAATQEYARFMHGYIKENLDATRLVTEVSLSAQNPNNPENAQGDSVYYADFICCNFYGGFRDNVLRVRNTYPDKPIFITEYGNGQTSEIPDRAIINPQAILDQWGDLPYVFGAAIWTLNDYRSDYGGTPLGQNRVWGVTTVWGDKKIGFEALRKASSPVAELSAVTSGDTRTEGATAVLLLQMRVRDIAEELPACALRGATLKWEALDAAGAVAASGLSAVPDMAPDGGVYPATAFATVPAGGLGAVRATVIDSLGYEIAETVEYLQAPAAAPSLTAVIAGSGSARVIFEGVDNAEQYAVTAQGGGKTATVTAALNRYADFTGLTPGETYSFTVSARNAAGQGPASPAVSAVPDASAGVLPPVIWHTEPVEDGFFVGYSVKDEGDTYELRWGTESGSYTDTVAFATEGGVKIAGRPGGETCYYQLRSLSGGEASAWSQEIAVTPETARQARPVPVVRGAAAGENAVSLTIDPVWKATGYTVKYGTDPAALTEAVYVNRAEVDQLMISGLETDTTYYFAAAAHNGDAVSPFSAPVSAATRAESGQAAAVAVVEDANLRFPFYQERAELHISALSFFEEPQTLTVRAEDLPAGVTVPDEMYFVAEQGVQTGYTVPVTVSREAVRGRHSIRVSVLNGAKVLTEKTVVLDLLDCEILFRDDFDADTGGDYASSGRGSFAVAEGRMSLVPDAATSPLLVTAGDAEWTDCVVESEMTMSGSANATSAGILFRYQDEKNFCHARIDETGGNCALQVYQWVGGQGANLASVPVPTARDGVYRLRVEVTGAAARAYLNDELMAEVTVAPSSGGAGFRAYGRTASYENLYVYRVIADKSALRALVDDCENYDESGYTADSWSAFAAALSAAQAALDRENAAQEEIDAAYAALEGAAAALEEAPYAGAPLSPTITRTRTLPDGTRIVTVTDRRTGAVTARIELPPGMEEAVVTVPVKGAGPDTVAISVDREGNETVVAWSVPVDGGIRLKVTGSVSLRFAQTQTGFDDVPADAWFAGGAAFTAARALFRGTGGGSFSPDALMTRSMLITVLYRLDGEENGSGGGTWYSAAVDWAGDKGISDGACLDDAVTREQLVTMLYRYAGSPAAAAPAAEFPDAGELSPWAADAAAWAVNGGLLTGRDGGRLEPRGSATRGEVAEILMRFIRGQLR